MARARFIHVLLFSSMLGLSTASDIALGDSKTSSSSTSTSSTSTSSTSTSSTSSTSKSSSSSSSASSSATLTSTSTSPTSTSTESSTRSSSYIPDFTPTNTENSFLRSPQCTSDLWSHYGISESPIPNDQYVFTAGAGETSTYTIKPTRYNKRTFTITGPTTTVYIDSAWMATTGPATGCCGVCGVTAYYLEVLYWPQPGRSSDCFPKNLPPRTREHDTRSAINTGNIPIPAGPVVTPRALNPLVRRDALGNETVYAVGDDGFTYISPSIYLMFETIWASDSCGHLGKKYTSITWSFQPEQLSTLNHLGYTKAFNFTELPCRPQPYTDGYYHEPTVAPAPQLTMLDPKWGNCWVPYWTNLDPPVALEGKGQLAVTTDRGSNPTSMPPAVPQSAESGSPTQTPPPPRPPQNPPAPPPPPPTQDPLPSQDPAPADQNPPNQAPPLQHAPAPATAPPGIPTLSAVPPPTTPPPRPPPINIGGETGSVNPSSDHVVIGSHTIKPGQPLVTIHGTPVSLDSKGVDLRIGTSTVNIRPVTPPAAHQPTVFSIPDGKGHIITQQPPEQGGGFIIDDQTVKAGEEGITVNGIPISLTGGMIIAGDKTFAVPTSAGTVEEVLFTPAPSGGIIVAGETISLGGKATIAGIEVSLDAGSVIVGGSTIVLPTTPVAGEAGNHGDVVQSVWENGRGVQTSPTGVVPTIAVGVAGGLVLDWKWMIGGVVIRVIMCI